jgi:four helix bundle protein
VDIRERVLQYAVRAVKLSDALLKQKNHVARTIGRQFLRSSTSIGANLKEARGGESRADFIHKYSIAQREARESYYWLRLLAASGIIKPSLVAPLVKETDEIIAIMTSIIVNTKERDRQN